MHAVTSAAVSTKSICLHIFLATVALFVALIIVTTVYSMLLVRMTSGVETFSSGSSRAFEMPLIDQQPETPHAVLVLKMWVPSLWSPRIFTRQYRTMSSLDTLAVNGTDVPVLPDQHTIDLSAFLHKGENVLTVSMHAISDPYIILGLEPSRRTILPWFYWILCVAAFLPWLSFVVRRLFSASLPREVHFLILAGGLLRATYACVMPAYITADSWGHQAYLWHVANHWSLPLSGTSWQAHQAPLYYFLTAPFVLLGERLQLMPTQTLLLVAHVSVLLSIVTLLIGVRTVRLFFGTDRTRMMLACALLASLPPLVHLASQENNDTLLVLMGFLWFERLLRACRHRRARDWCSVGLCIGVGLLTKGNALLWVPVSLLCLWFSIESWSLKRQCFMAMLLPLTLVAGPLFAWRFFGDPNYQLLANTRNITRELFVLPTFHSMFSFDPLAVLRHGAMNPADLRSYVPTFFESIFTTGHFGLNLYGREASILLVLGMFLFPLSLLGMMSTFRREAFVLPVSVIGLVVGLLFFRLRFPYESSQNFRYILPLCLPLVLLLAEGARRRTFTARAVSEVLLMTYAIVSAAFFLGILFAI